MKEEITKFIKLDDISYKVDFTITTSYDPNYGADADGNRGIAMSFIDDIHADEIINTETEEEINIKDPDQEPLIDAIIDEYRRELW